MLTYGQRPDWGQQGLSPKYMKAYGLFVVALSCLYRWKFGIHKAPHAFLVAVDVLIVVLGTALLAQFTVLKSNSRAFFLFYLLALACLCISAFVVSR